MKKLFLLLAAGFCFSAVFAQNTEDAQTLHETARVFMKQGDYENALFVLNKALAIAPDDLDILKDKTFVSYLKRDFAGAKTNKWQAKNGQCMRKQNNALYAHNILHAAACGV